MHALAEKPVRKGVQCILWYEVFYDTGSPNCSDSLKSPHVVVGKLNSDKQTDTTDVWSMWGTHFKILYMSTRSRRLSSFSWRSVRVTWWLRKFCPRQTCVTPIRERLRYTRNSTIRVSVPKLQPRLRHRSPTDREAKTHAPLQRLVVGMVQATFCIEIMGTGTSVLPRPCDYEHS